MTTTPSRTCLGCRRVYPKGALVRLVRLSSGTVVVDAGARAAGRGAYVCPDTACVERALGRGRLAHAFRKPSDAGPDLAEALRAAARRGTGVMPSGADVARRSGTNRASDTRRSDVMAMRA